MKLRLGLPKGSLQEATADLFRKAGYKITYASRSYYPAIDDPEIQCTLLRAQEMPRYVQDGSLDCGLTGYDWILENDSKVKEIAELVFSKVSRRPVRWVLAVPESSPFHHVRDLEGKVIATELVAATRRYLEEHLIAKRTPDSDITDDHRDVAAAIGFLGDRLRQRVQDLRPRNRARRSVVRSGLAGKPGRRGTSPLSRTSHPASAFTLIGHQRELPAKHAHVGGSSAPPRLAGRSRR